MMLVLSMQLEQAYQGMVIMINYLKTTMTYTHLIIVASLGFCFKFVQDGIESAKNVNLGCHTSIIYHLVLK